MIAMQLYPHVAALAWGVLWALFCTGVLVYVVLAIGGSIQGVDIASNLSGSPRSRRVESKEEKRLYFMWTDAGPLMQYDRQLLQRASIQLQNRSMLKFIPPDLENQLARIELDYAKEHGHNSVTEIAKTIFESKAAGGGYAFEVIDQRYRKPRR